MSYSCNPLNRLEAFLALNKGLTARLCVYFASLFLIVYYFPAILQNDIFAGDMAVWTPWAYSFRDGDLFRGDINNTYWIANFPLGYFFILKLLSPYIDPQILGESIGFVLGALATFLGFLVGREVTGGRTWGGIAVIALIVLSQFIPSSPINFLARVAGGLPRGYALAIVLLGVLSVLRQKLSGLGWAFVFGAIFYPPACIILGTYAALVLAFRIWKERSVPKGMLLLALLAMGAAAILVAATLNSRETTGPVYSLNQMLSMPEFWPGGSLVFFYGHWFDYILAAMQLGQGSLGVICLLFTVLMFTTGAIKNDRRLLRAEIVLIPVSAVINYAVAYLFMLRLYEPSRYLVFAYQALTICCFPLFVGYAVNWLAPRLSGIALSDGARKTAWRAAFVLVTAIGIAAFSARVALKRGGAPDPMPSEVYEFLQTLPKDTLIASTPTDGDRIPMRSRRRVLYVVSSLFPYHPLYYSTMKERFDAVLAAMYSPGPEQLLALKQRFGVRYFIVHSDLARHDPVSDVQPFRNYVSTIEANLGEKQPYVLSVMSSASVFEKGGFSVLDLDRIEQMALNQSQGNRASVDLKDAPGPPSVREKPSLAVR